MIAMMLCRIFCLSSVLPKNLQVMIHRDIILSVVFCGRETWSCTLREKHTLRVLENRELTEMFKRDEVTGDWKTLLNGEPNTIRVIKSRIKKCVRQVAGMGKRRSA